MEVTLGLDNKIVRREVLRETVNDPNFWNASNREEVLKEYNDLNLVVDDIIRVKEKIEVNIELLNELLSKVQSNFQNYFNSLMS